MLNIIIHTESNTPIYEQIIKAVKKALLQKELQTGDMLPSIRALAKDLEISVITTKRAYVELEKEGLICSVQGKGFYVKEPDHNRLREQQLTIFEEKLSGLIKEGKELGLELSDLQDILKTLYEG